MSEKVRRWVLFSILGSCIPFLVNVVGPMVVGGAFPGLGPITEHGDLYLVGTTLCAASLGELFGTANVKKEAKQYAGFAGIGSFFTCASFYAYASTNLQGLKIGSAVIVQVVTFSVAVISSIACIAASEAK